MTALRRHLLGLLALLFALAAGIALGAGPLAGAATERVADRPAPAPAEAVPAGDDVTARLLDAATPALIADGLTDQRVAVLVAPGADLETVAAVRGLVGLAGGRVSSVVPLGETLLAPSEKTLVDTLGSQLVAQDPDTGVDPDAATYDRIGGLLARALLTRDGEPQPVDRTAESVLASLATATMVAAPEGEVTTRATYAVLVLPEQVDADGATPDETAGTDAVWRSLVAGISGGARGTVVLGAPADPALDRWRAAAGSDGSWDRVTSIDAAARPAALAGVLALTDWPESAGRAVGASGADDLPLMD